MTATTTASVSCYSFGATHLCSARSKYAHAASLVSKSEGFTDVHFAGAASSAHFAQGTMGSLRASQSVNYEHEDMARCAK